MPQFDIISFFNQIFWFSLFISLFFFLILKYILPSISQSLKFRTKYFLFMQKIINLNSFISIKKLQIFKFYGKLYFKFIN